MLKPKIAKEPPKPAHGRQKGSSKLKRKMTGKINTERLIYRNISGAKHPACIPG